MLCAQQRADQWLVDLDVCWRLAVMDDGGDHRADSSVLVASGKALSTTPSKDETFAG
jgi:hypothetical protein